jgi:hypothetical protein
MIVSGRRIAIALRTDGTNDRAKRTASDRYHLSGKIVAGGILMHYLVARGLAAWRDKSRAQQIMTNRAHTIQMASPSNRLVVRNKPARESHLSFDAARTKLV